MNQPTMRNAAANLQRRFGALALVTALVLAVVLIVVLVLGFVLAVVLIIILILILVLVIHFQILQVLYAAMPLNIDCPVFWGLCFVLRFEQE